METQPLIRPEAGRRGTVLTIAGAGNNFSLLQKRSRFILGKAWVNLLLVFVPLGLLSGYLEWHASAVFALNFLALIPLENVLHIMAENLLLPRGPKYGTALSLVLPHVFPLLIGTTSLATGNIQLAKAFIIGSLLCNHLLGLGLCFLLSSINQQESIFPATGTNTEACLLYLLATPFAGCKLLSPEYLSSPYDSHQAILLFSRGTAIVFLCIYITFLFFRLHTHRHLWQDEESSEYPEEVIEDLPSPLYLLACIICLGSTFIISMICTRYLILSVPGTVVSSHLSVTFIGLVLLPIITHTCKYIKTSVIAYQGHPEISVAMTLGTSVDIAFFGLPALVLIGWLIGADMTMEFALLENIVTILSILVMAGFVLDGKSNYLEGAMSLGLYAIIVITYAIHPDPAAG